MLKPLGKLLPSVLPKMANLPTAILYIYVLGNINQLQERMKVPAGKEYKLQQMRVKYDLWFLKTEWIITPQKWGNAINVI